MHQGRTRQGPAASPGFASVLRRFLRYKNVPGLAVGHPAVLYDSVSDLYWMASNVNRDSGACPLPLPSQMTIEHLACAVAVMARCRLH